MVNLSHCIELWDRSNAMTVSNQGWCTNNLKMIVLALDSYIVKIVRILTIARHSDSSEAL